MLGWALTGRIIIVVVISIQAKACLQTNSEHGLPFFQGYESCDGCPGGPKRRIHHQHQAIIPSYKFNCCGNITEWGVDLNPLSPQFNFDLQVWRPYPTVNNTECYNLIANYTVKSASVDSVYRVVKATALPQNQQLQFQLGDVLGFYVESHGSGAGARGDADNGVVLLNNGSHTSELVWYGHIDIIAQTFQSGSCPYPVGTNGVLNTSTHAAPVISIAVVTTPCPTNDYSSLGSIISTPSLDLTRMRGQPFKSEMPQGTNYATVPGSLSNGLIAGVVVGIFVVVSIIVTTIIIATIIVKRHSRTKQTGHTGMALSNPVYCTPERDQLNATYACLDRSGLYAVNPLNQVNQYAEVANQYAVVGLEGQEGGATGRNGEYETSSHSKDIMANEIDLFDVAGVYMYVPTTEERSNWEGHYEMQNVNNHIYSKLTFFVEDQTYWAPASTTSNLYSQLASKKYREIPREQIRTLTELGSGEFGNVCKAAWSISGTIKEMAVKTLKPGSPENDRVRFLQEAAIMGQFNHPHVVKLYGVVTVEDPIVICFELMINGNLRDHLGTLFPNSGVLKELKLQLLRFSRQIASGMTYLSKKAFVHRDLAARNILLDEALTCKVSDFGMARDLADSTYYTVQSKGGKIPVKWTAPEALFYKKYSTDSDVWSYGMVLFEIWSVGKKPFSEITNKEVLKKINSGYCQPPPPGCPRPIYQLMVNCWNPVHSQRPPFSNISATLNASSSTLLQWTGDDCSVAGELGGQLSEAQFLYQDLQNSYLQ